MKRKIRPGKPADSDIGKVFRGRWSTCKCTVIASHDEISYNKKGRPVKTELYEFSIVDKPDETYRSTKSRFFVDWVLDDN